jgi:hypothetical protein
MLMLHLRNLHGYNVGMPEGSGSVDALQVLTEVYSIHKLLDRAFKIEFCGINNFYFQI